MAELKTLSVKKRTAFGKGANRRLRAEALVPGVYYTADGQNIPVQMPELPLVKMYEQVGRTNVFQLELEDENGAKTLHPVFVWDAQYSPVKSTFTHIDFLGVDLDKEIQVKVQVEYAGTPKGVKVGGKMETYRDEVVLAAKPTDIYDYIPLCKIFAKNLFHNVVLPYLDAICYHFVAESSANK